MTTVINQTGNSVSAAGRPDLGKLAQLGVITIGPDGWPTGNAKNPVIGEKTITIRIEGVKVQKAIPVQGGHARNPDNPAWRAGLTPEKYHKKVLLEAEKKAATGKNFNIAPELMAEEAEDYLLWLEKKGIEQPDNSVLRASEDVEEEVLAKTVQKAKKAVASK